MNPSFRYQLGDLVEFKAPRVTEEYIDDIMVSGIVVKQRWVFTAANRFKVQTPNGSDYPHVKILYCDDQSAGGCSAWRVAEVLNEAR